MDNTMFAGLVIFVLCVLRKSVATGEITAQRNVAAVAQRSCDGFQRGATHMDRYARLQEERLRLDLSKERVAEIAGAVERTVSRWERNTGMSIAALSALAEHGYDAQYVCTGRRSMNNKAPLGKQGASEDTPYVPAFAPDEVEWITRLRKLDPDQRRQLQAVFDVLAPKPRRARRPRHKPAQDVQDTVSTQDAQDSVLTPDNASAR
jgi:transcriptional regulator with XRE-family HTH domain